MPAVDYLTYYCSSSRTTSGVIIIQELHTGVITQDGDRWQFEKAN